MISKIEDETLTLGKKKIDPVESFTYLGNIMVAAVAIKVRLVRLKSKSLCRKEI
jgi:hypothetical protein